MTDLLVFSLIVFGIAWGVGHAELSFPVRLAISKGRFGNVIISGLECFGCLSWHLGWVAFVFQLAPSPLNSWWKAAFFASAASLLLARIAGLTEIAPPEGGAFDRKREARDPRQAEVER